MEQETKEECPLCGQEMNDEAKAEKAKIDNLKELYKRYCTCRDQELDRFWKNSVFVWCFLLLCFTTLGKIIYDYNTQYGCDIFYKGLTEDTYYQFLFIISILGLFLSNIWVWMARGLKAWYEVFENVIWKMESYDNVFEYPQDYTIDKFWVVKGSNNYWQRLLVSPASISTSRIVILIGRFLVIVWLCVFTYTLWKYSKCDFYFDLTKINWTFNITFISVVIVICLSNLLVRSSTLKTDEEIEFENSLISNIKANIFDKNMWNGQLEYRYYADVLLSALEQGVTTKGNKYFKRIIIDTKKQNFYMFNHIYDNPNNTIEITELTHRDTMLNYLNNVLLNHNRLDTKHYIIRIIKPINYPRSTIRYKIKCHICLRYIINEFFEREIFKI